MNVQKMLPLLHPQRLSKQWPDCRWRRGSGHWLLPRAQVALERRHSAS